MTADVLASIDGALRDFGTSNDAMRWQPEGRRPAGGHIGGTVAVVVTVDTEQFTRSLDEFIRMLTCAVRAAVKPAAPKPLAVDGREYHRRQQARRKRKR